MLPGAPEEALPLLCHAEAPAAGGPPHGLLSAGLSPRALAISLKEGRSFGLRAQQRCISRYSLEGQPSGCGSRALPACRSVGAQGQQVRSHTTVGGAAGEGDSGSTDPRSLKPNSPCPGSLWQLSL